MEAIDFRTQKEKEREIRDNSICANYLALAEKYPYVRPARIFERLAEKYKMSAIGVRLVVIKHGIITPKQRTNLNTTTSLADLNTIPQEWKQSSKNA